MTKRKSIIALIILVLGAVGILAYLNGSGEVEDGDLPPEAGVECPHSWQWSSPAVAANIQAFTGGRDEVPELNDCERFFKVGSSSAPAYTTGVFALFISDSVATDDTVGPAGNTVDTAAVALVRALAEYAPLGILSSEFYCLILIRERGAWRGGMAPAGTDANCLKPELAKLHELAVVRRPIAPPRDLPNVVRWGFDGIPATGAAPGSWVHYAIVPCDGSICYVGPTRGEGVAPGFVPKLPQAILTDISQNLPTGGRVRAVDGWHDTQFLASPSPGSGDIQPATPRLVGSLIPDSALASRTPEAFEEGWVPVAEVAMSAKSGYEAKFNFSATTGSTYNTIEACMFTDSPPGNCEGLPSYMTCSYDKPVGSWRTRHTNAVTKAVTYHCVDLRPFPSIPSLVVPGTVRWKWDEKDEKAWFRCPEGCCLIAE